MYDDDVGKNSTAQIITLAGKVGKENIRGSSTVWFASNCMCLLIIFVASGGCTLIWMMSCTVNKLL